MSAIEFDPVNRPKHYNTHPSGVECIQITEDLNFPLGNAFKYLFRAEEKNGMQDYEKAVWYIDREISRIEDKMSGGMASKAKLLGKVCASEPRREIAEALGLIANPTRNELDKSPLVYARRLVKSFIDGKIQS